MTDDLDQALMMTWQKIEMPKLDLDAPALDLDLDLALDLDLDVDLDPKKGKA